MPRRLGQHFLRPDSVEDLLRVIAPAAGDVFLEIGPGTYYIGVSVFEGSFNYRLRIIPSQ